MGYRSDVCIVADKKTYREILRIAQKVDFEPHEHYETADGNACIKWDSVKWYQGFPYIDQIEACLKKAQEEYEKGQEDRFAVFFRDGEDTSDIEFVQYGNEDATYEYYVESKLQGIAEPAIEHERRVDEENKSTVFARAAVILKKADEEFGIQANVYYAQEIGILMGAADMLGIPYTDLRKEYEEWMRKN